MKKIGKLNSAICVVVVLFFFSSSGSSADISRQGGYAFPKTPEIPAPTLTPTSYPRTQPLIEPSVRSLNPISFLNENRIEGQLSIPTCRKLYAKVTAYTCCVVPRYCETFTSTRPKWGTVAVDPKIIGFGSMIYIPDYGVGIAEDTGAWIEGNHIDIWFPTEKKALEWGVKWLEITVCEPSP